MPSAPKYIAPHTTRRRPIGSKRQRLGELAAILLLAFAVFTASDAGAAALQPLAEIRAAAIAAVGASDAQAQATLDPGLRLARCQQPLQATASGARTAQVRCADTPGWRLYVPVRVHREADVVVLTAPVAAGVPIAASQLTVQRRDIGRAAAATFSDPAALVGRIPGRALAPGLVPTEADLAVGIPLRRGDPVVLVSRSGGVEVRMQGRALGPARPGGVVAVENTNSRRVLRGRVAAQGVVEVLP
ncbi:flagellar basal body P-ring formation chaperone FlgA [Lysobacter koreensis]|uniref:Flagella basal body P-ring formation protein FlgA n=1 Tax=Lysobacter koreensis TaxID=266122 RepID=A0ABW2YKT3_9GAMM